MPGPVVLEFGAGWCPHCQALAPVLEQELAKHPDVQHIAIEDGPGKRLGRSFRVKLWPTLVFLRDGEAREQMARPNRKQVQDGFASITQVDG